MSRSIEIREEPSFYGHGLAIEAFPASSNSELDSLKEENKHLKEQLQYQQQLLSIWHLQPCTLCQVQQAPGNPAASSSTNNRASRPTRTNSRGTATTATADAAAGGSSSSNSAHSCLEKAFRQQQVLIAQLQRQVIVLEVELSSREQLVLEADAVLAELSRRLSALLALQDVATALGPGLSAGGASRTTVRGTTVARPTTSSSQRPGSRPSHIPPAAAGSAVGNSNIDVAAVKQLLEQAHGVFAWCKSSEARISRAKAESAAKCRAARSSCLAAIHAVGSERGSSHGWDADQEGPSALQQLRLQYAPAGGNRFMKQGSVTTLSCIATGQGVAALDAAALHQLVPQLAGLSHGLAALAVQLRSIILPALPWVAAVAGEQLTNSTAVLAESAAIAAGQLVEACSVLSAVAGTLSRPAATVARRHIVQKAAAIDEAAAWGDAGSISGSAAAGQNDADAVVQELLQLNPEDCRLLERIADIVGAAAAVAKGGSCSWNGKAAAGSSARRLSGAGGNSTVSPSRQQQQHTQQQQQLISDLLQKVQQRWRGIWLKKQVLELQLSFVARCSSEQAKLVSRLTHDVATALTEAVDAAEQQDDVQHRRLDVQHLVQQLQRVMLLIQQRPGEVAAAGNAVRTLVGLLEQQEDVLQDIPELLQVSSGPALKAAALAALTAAFQDFRSQIHGAQQATDTLCRQMTAASLTTERQQEA